MSTDKEKALHSIVLINAIWKACQELGFDKVMSICEQTCWNIKEYGVDETFIGCDFSDTDKYVRAVFKKNGDGTSTLIELSDEADAKQLDDAQRYRDIKSTKEGY